MSRYYTLDEDTYPRFLHDNEEEMDFFAFIHVVDPTKVKIVERERAEGEPKLLDSTGDSAASSGHDAVMEPVTVVGDIAAENVIAERPKRQRKKRLTVTDASGSSHPPKKLREDYETPSVFVAGGKSLSVIKELLASSILSAEVGVKAVATLPFITSSIYAMPEREGGDPTDSISKLNLHTICPSERFVISSDSSHRSSTNATKVEVDSYIRSTASLPVMTEAVITTNIDSTIKPDVAGPCHLPENKLSIGSREINSETLHEVFVPQWNVPNDTLLDDHDISQEFIDHLAPPVLFAQIREMDYHHLFTKVNIGTAHQACLNAEVRMQTECCLSERRRLESNCGRQADLLKAMDGEIENLKAKLLVKEAEGAEAACLRIQVSAIKAAGKDLELKDVNATMSSLKSQNDGLVDQVHVLETTCFHLRDQVLRYEQLKDQIEEFQEAQMNIVNDKVAKLDADLLEMALHLEEKFYPHLLTTISGRRWLLTHGRSLADVVAYNPAAKADFNSALQRLYEVDFPFLAELNSRKDASVEDIMNLLYLEIPLADAPGMSDLQPDVEQLMLPIYHFEDQVVLGETSLSFSLSVANSRVESIRKGVTERHSSLADDMVPLVDPLSVENLTCVVDTSVSVPTTTAVMTALSVTSASASSVPLITIDDYDIAVQIVRKMLREMFRKMLLLSPRLNLRRESWTLPLDPI
ncbi:hypothetical protein Tco_0250585 [Tanacetum coccineum]